MTPLCPVAAIASCQYCLISRICPAKSILGDQPLTKSAEPEETPASETGKESE